VAVGLALQLRGGAAAPGQLRGAHRQPDHQRVPRDQKRTRSNTGREPLIWHTNFTRTCILNVNIFINVPTLPLYSKMNCVMKVWKDCEPLVGFMLNAWVLFCAIRPIQSFLSSLHYIGQCCRSV
jgi:hypothetical protein